MGVYINMEMPTSCSVCWALDDYGDYPRCRITEEQRGYNFQIIEKRMDKCPLIPIPVHGRLIDADALLTNKGVGTQIAGWGKMYHETCIEYAPTIIPATNKE